MRVCQTKHYADKKLANIATNLNPLEKSLYVAGIELPERLDLESKQILKQGLSEVLNEYVNDGLYEGKFGLSPRDVKHLIYKLSSSHTNVTFVEVLEYLEEVIQKKNEYDFLNMAPQADYHNPARYLDLIKENNLNVFDRELRNSLGLVDDRSYEDYIRRYIENVNASFQEMFFNGTLDSQDQPIMVGATLTDLTNDLLLRLMDSIKEISKLS